MFQLRGCIFFLSTLLLFLYIILYKMKKSILTLFSIFLWNIGFAQIPVTDVATNGQLVELNIAMQELNALMKAQKGTS